MKCLILAAGYATRLYPLTENFPKPLLEVAGKPILDWLIDDMNQTGMIDEYIVVTNHKFAPIFEEWSKGFGQKSKAPSTSDLRPSTSDRRWHTPITIVDDGTTTNENRLGAVKDIQFAIDKLSNRKSSNRKWPDDLLVMAGDNLLDFSLAGFIRYARDKQATCVMRYYEPDESKLHKTGVAEIDEEGLILSMEEKPAEPKSHWCIPAFYCYTKEDCRLIKKGIDSGCGIDAPGSFIVWLSSQTSVYTWEMPGHRYDIGNLASYESVKNTYTPPVINREK